MTPRLRRLLFVAAIFALAPLAVLVLRRLPPFGHYPGPYGDAVNALVPGARQVTNMVTAINFDLRALDTIAYVRFASVYRRFEDVSEFEDVIEEFRRMNAPAAPAKPSRKR